MYRFMLFVVLILANGGAAVSGQSKVIFFQQGKSLRFVAVDITSVELKNDENGGGAVVVLSLTSTMSERLKSFSSGLVGRRMMTISGDQMLMSDTKVKTAISGPVIHIFGTDTQRFRLLADRLKRLRLNRVGVSKPLLVAAEQLSKLDVQSSDISYAQYIERQGAILLHLSADMTNFSTLLDDSSGWILTIDGRQFDNWTATKREDFIELKITGKTPSQSEWLHKNFKSLFASPR